MANEGGTEPPKLYQHCVRLYELMEQDAKDASDGKVYEGSLGELIKTIGLSQSYHSKIVNRLKAMGCIAMLERGSGTYTKSKWALYVKPTMELFAKAVNTGDVKWIQQAETYNAHEQRLNDLSRRIQKIEDWAMEQGMVV